MWDMGYGNVGVGDLVTYGGGEAILEVERIDGESVMLKGVDVPLSLSRIRLIEAAVSVYELPIEPGASFIALKGCLLYLPGCNSDFLWQSFLTKRAKDEELPETLSVFASNLDWCSAYFDGWVVTKVSQDWVTAKRKEGAREYQACLGPIDSLRRVPYRPNPYEFDLPKLLEGLRDWTPQQPTTRTD